MDEQNKKSPEQNNSFVVFFLFGMLLTQILITGTMLFTYILLRNQLQEIRYPVTSNVQEPKTFEENFELYKSEVSYTTTKTLVLTMLQKNDQYFSTMLNTRNSWRTFKHPDDIYTIEYPIALDIDKADPNELGIKNSEYDVYQITYEENPNFSLFITFVPENTVTEDDSEMGRRSGKYNVLEYSNLDPLHIDSYDDQGSEEILENTISDFIRMKLIFKPTEDSELSGVLWATYENETQRDVIKEIVDSFELDTEEFSADNE